jgi:hypothetical protein
MPVTRQRTGGPVRRRSETRRVFRRSDNPVRSPVRSSHGCLPLRRTGRSRFMELDGRTAHGRFLSPRIRRTEVWPILRRRAISALLTPARYSFPIWLVFLPAVRGRPRCMPFSRASAMPARIRSRRISCSNSANTESKPAIARPVGVVKSSASVRDTKPTPSSASSLAAQLAVQIREVRRLAAGGLGGNTLRVELHSIFETQIGERDNAPQFQFVVQQIVSLAWRDWSDLRGWSVGSISKWHLA